MDVWGFWLLQVAVDHAVGEPVLADAGFGNDDGFPVTLAIPCGDSLAGPVQLLLLSAFPEVFHLVALRSSVLASVRTVETLSAIRREEISLAGALGASRAGTREAGKEIADLVQQLNREIRTTSYLLHPPLLDESGLSSALNEYVQGLAERSGIAITIEIDEKLGRLPRDMELAIFRLVQECLTNIHRHSGSTTARIRVFLEGDGVRVEVTDKGKGILPERLTEIQSGGSGVGTRGMRERLSHLRGTLTIESNSSGTRVAASIPIPREATASMAVEDFQAAV